MVMRIPGDIVIYRYIWGRQPKAEFLMPLVTYEVVSAHVSRNGDIKGYERSILFTPTASSCITTSKQSQK